MQTHCIGILRSHGKKSKPHEVNRYRINFFCKGEKEFRVGNFLEFLQVLYEKKPIWLGVCKSTHHEDSEGCWYKTIMSILPAAMRILFTRNINNAINCKFQEPFPFLESPTIFTFFGLNKHCDVKLWAIKGLDFVNYNSYSFIYGEVLDEPTNCSSNRSWDSLCFECRVMFCFCCSIVLVLWWHLVNL